MKQFFKQHAFLIPNLFKAVFCKIFTWHNSDAERWKTLEMPVIISGDNLPYLVGIGLPDLPNIGGEIRGWWPRICKKFEINRTICSNSERSEQFLVTECFLACFHDFWRFWRKPEAQSGSIFDSNRRVITAVCNERLPWKKGKRNKTNNLFVT